MPKGKQDAGTMEEEEGPPEWWKTPITGCMEDSSGCCDWFWCYPCNYGRNCQAIGTVPPEGEEEENLEAEEDDGEENTGNCKMCLISGLCFPLYICFACGLRKKLGEKYHFNLTAVDWCCMAYLCPCCSNCQVGRELTLRGKWPGGACCNDEPYNKGKEDDEKDDDKKMK